MFYHCELGYPSVPTIAIKRKKRGADIPRLRMEAVRSALRCRCSNQSTLYARTVHTVLASYRSFSHFHSQVEHNASLFKKFRKRGW